MNGTSLGVQWLRFQIPNAEDQGSIPGQITRHAATKSFHAMTKTQYIQIK